MQIKNMFEKQIDRDIKGVIKVGQSDEENVYQIYSVYRCEPSDDTYTTGFMFRTKSYMDWLNETLTKETYETGAEQMVNAGQQVLTLSTCADGDRKDRLVVNCVEVDKDDGQKRTEREY